jgi:hypothetical protein
MAATLFALSVCSKMIISDHSFGKYSAAPFISTAFITSCIQIYVKIYMK